MPSSFADRLWWARHNAGLGATKLTRLVGCAQSLVSHIENQNAEKSQFNNEFAKALHVDPTWLAFGAPERAPPNFDEEVARKRGKGVRPNPVRPPAPSNGTGVMSSPPRWADAVEVAPLEPPVAADTVMESLIGDFTLYVKLAGPERATALLDILRQLAQVMSARAEKPSGD